MQTIDLCGKWTVAQAGKKDKIAATVPGCIHTDLMAAGKIEDPYYRDNEKRVQWISEQEWVYSRKFKVDKDTLAKDRVLLHCDGLDTVATIKLNGKTIGKTDNMYRTWEFDVKKTLKCGENSIEIKFASATKYIEARHKKNKTGKNPIGWGTHHSRRSWLRKEPCNFGWDWGPVLPTCGIWRAINITAFNTARIADVLIEQKHSAKSVELQFTVNSEKAGKGKVTADITVSHNGKIVSECQTKISGKSAKCKTRVNNPQLWWPNGMGEQNMYEVTVDLVDEDGGLLDTTTKRIGLRTLVLETKKDKWGETFQFKANGKVFFAKGANWIPADTFDNRISDEQYAYLIKSAADTNMNFIRVWGGGIYENDIFYNLCDEMGVCVWQDFMFACASYPTFDKAFMANVTVEAEQNVKRLRHHPSIALWCGNNELEQGLAQKSWSERSMSWEDYKKLFDKALKKIVNQYAPGASYWPGSPHTPHGDRQFHRDPTCGDAHLWDVWHGRKPFEWYRTTDHRFVSEFGFQSFPEPKTVNGYTEKADRNVTSFVMEHHQRSGIGNTTIMQYMLDWFLLPKDFDSTLWLSQILQSLGIKYAVEWWRSQMPRTMGAIYWQLNDCWPVASWASIDYHGRWKALNYSAKRFFAPLLITGVEDMESGNVDIYVTSDKMVKSNTVINWTITDVDGKTLESGKKSYAAAAQKSAKATTLKLKKILDKQTSHNLLVWIELTEKGKTMSENMVLFARPKHMALKQPEIKAKVKDNGDGTFDVKLGSKKAALWAWLEIKGADANFSDNFFHMRPSADKTITITPWKKLTKAQLEKGLIVRSLIDTY